MVLRVQDGNDVVLFSISFLQFCKDSCNLEIQLFDGSWCKIHFSCVFELENCVENLISNKFDSIFASISFDN